MINSRLLLVYLFILTIFLILTLKLTDIQIGSHEKYLKIAVGQQQKSLPMRAERGRIFDTNKELLAYTLDDVSFGVDKRMLNKIETDTLIKTFAKIFNRTENYYRKIINKGKGNVKLEKKASKEKAILLKEMDIDALIRNEDYSRIYPYQGLASHIIGYVNQSCLGIEGLEKELNDYLTGIDGKLYVERDGLGKIIAIDEERTKAPVPGNEVYLTINKTYQKILEDELEAGKKQFDSRAAIGIIMNPNNGRILALANNPNFDPSNYKIYSSAERRNRAIIDTYEPGSTIKAMVMSILIDNDLVDLNETLDTENGAYRVKGAIIRDTHKYKKLTVREILELSSNIGMAKLSDRMDSKTLYKYMRDFGFGNYTSIDLPGEAKGRLKKPDEFQSLTKKFMSFGYELSVTPLQMVTAFSALVNGGVLYQPYIIDKITDFEGKIIKENDPRRLRQVIKSSTSDKMRDLLVGVVENGTAKNARMEKIYVGGKTGTSQQLENGGYSKKNYNSSFIGYFPADNPQIVCLILLDAPQNAKYGGAAAAPIFKEITKKILEADVNIQSQDIKIAKNSNSFEKVIPEEPSFDFTEDEITSSNIGETKDTISESVTRNNTKTFMPNLLNKSKKSAISILKEIGLKFSVEGTGHVISQSIQPGERISPGLVCNLKFKPVKNLDSIKIE